ncbi:MAG: DUF3048 domain-containing protein [Candidatus Saccharimonadales bacterium]
MDFKTPPKRTFNQDVRRSPGVNPNQTPESVTPPEQPVEPKFPGLVPDEPKEIDKSEPPREDLRITPAPERRSRKRLFILIGIAVALLIAAGAVYWFVLKPKKQVDQVTPVATKTEVKKAVVVKPTSPLTGVTLTDATLAKRPVTGIMIENSPDARPQSGLTDAGVVYEAIAEGGITRFLAVFQDSKPNYIGPVRSARPYYIDFVAPYDAGYGHVGGSPQALSDIKSLGIKDLDQFYNGDSYVRVSERYAPHNVYTGFDKLDKLNQSKGYTTSTFTAFKRKVDVPQTPTASTIDFAISSPLYSPHYVYDAATNTYKRSQGGEAHIDAKSKQQIAPKVVIALVMDKSYDPDGYHTDYKTTGSGKMYVFQDGIVSEGTWAKSDRKSQFEFTDKNGLPMKLNAGQTWISVVANQSDVTYKP